MSNDNITEAATVNPMPTRSTAIGLVLFLMAIAVGGFILLRPQPPLLPASLSSSDYSAAQRRYVELFGILPEHLDSLAIAGEIAVSEKNWEQAAACFREVPTNHPRFGASARLQEAQVLVRLNRAADAERAFQTFFALPEHRRFNAVTLAGAGKWLNFVLSAQLRFEDRKRWLVYVHELGIADVLDSKQLHFPNLLIWNSPLGRKRCNEFLAADPGNIDLQVASARYLTAEGKLEAARESLMKLSERHPRDQRILAATLECDFERNDWLHMEDVEHSLPQFDKAESWLLTRMRGELAMHHKDWSRALEYFQQVLLEDPANSWSQMGIVRALGELGRADEQKSARAKSAALAKIRVSVVKVTDRDPGAANALADLCNAAGLIRAAQDFRQHARHMENSPVNSTQRDSPELP